MLTFDSILSVFKSLSAVPSSEYPRSYTFKLDFSLGHIKLIQINGQLFSFFVFEENG